VGVVTAVIMAPLMADIIGNEGVGHCVKEGHGGLALAMAREVDGGPA
jgi:hypothetical protein